jgi:dCMP deaminase
MSYRDEDWLRLASCYAARNSGCTKVAVGSVIVSKSGKLVSIGANRTIPDVCKHVGCLRVKKYGDNAKTHRNPDDCRALHSEIDAICNAGCDLSEATIYVTRYPCEACARAIAAAGITTVIYGRDQEISGPTWVIFESANIEVIHLNSYKEEDVIE